MAAKRPLKSARMPQESRHNFRGGYRRRAFTRCGSFTLNFFSKIPTPRPCLLELRPKVLPKDFAFSFCATRFCPTALFQGSCPIASVPEVLPRGFSPGRSYRALSDMFESQTFNLPGLGFTRFVPEVSSHIWLTRSFVPAVFYFKVWQKPMKSAEQSPNTHE